MAFTRASGLPRSFNTLSGIDAIDAEGVALDCLMEEFSTTERDLRRSQGQCLKWSHYFEDRIARRLNVPAMVTIGQLWRVGRAIYSPSWADCYRWLRNGVGASDLEGRGGIPWHAWITLQTGELIDLTWGTTLAKFAGHTHTDGGLIWGRDPTMITSYRYVPMLVGRAAAEGIAQRTPFPLLASSDAELPEVAVVAFFDR